MKKPPVKFFALFLLTVVSLPFFAFDAAAERLPVKIYTSADGLGSSFVNHIMRDSRGFMWFCTRDGLSRFDGSRFVTYQVGAENPAPGIEVIYQTRNGDYWITTTGGFYRFKSDAISLANQANTGRPTLNVDFISAARGKMLEDRAGNLWFSAGLNLNHLKEQDGKIVIEKFPLNLPPHPARDFGVHDMLEAKDGSLWLNTSWGVARRLPDGRIIFYENETKDTQGNLSMIIAADGRIWVSRALELFIINPEPLESLTDPSQIQIRPLRGTHFLPAEKDKEIRLPELPGEILFLTGGDFLTRNFAKRLYETSDRHMWLTTDRSLVEFDGRTFQIYTPAQGLPAGLSPMREDAAGNLWIGGRNGLARLDRKGLITYGTADGFKSDAVHVINEARDGTLFFADSEFYLNRFDGKKFEAARPAMQMGVNFLWTSRFAFLDSRNEWWILTNERLYRFAATDLSKPLAIYTTADGLKANQMFQIYEDSRGDIWVSVKPARNNGIGLSRFVREENRFHTFTEAEGFPPNKSVSSFVEDAHGNLWLGFYESGAARFSGGKFTTFLNDMPRGVITDLLVDKSGRLWLTSSDSGLMRVDDASADALQFARFTTDNGLSSNNIRTITEDRFGRIYLGTVRGVDRLSPDTGQIKNYSISDGLASDFVIDSHCDRSGTLWFATMGGLSRLSPLPDDQPFAATVWIDGLWIAGNRQPVSQLGNAEIEKGELTYTENNLQFDFFGLDFRAGENLRYQYRLEGASNADWTQPSEQRSVIFANLQPGTYRFMVRAVNSEGVVSEKPAVVSFKILPPVWARWWFIVLCALLATVFIILLYRYRTANLRKINAALSEAKRAEEDLRHSREERIVELEKVRSRIATDLHDDIGASLTQIAVLSEVAQTQSKGNGTARQPLRMISSVSNELVETMSDIVWSINPNKDHLGDLTQRMRRFASDVLSAKGIGLHFDAPDSETNIVINTNLRREVFLIFKETVNNIVKHSGAEHVQVELKISDENLLLEISDDGKGFDESGVGIADFGLTSKQTKNRQFQIPTPKSFGGNGIPSVKRRAEEMNGELEIVSKIGEGTTVNLRLPLEKASEASSI